MDIFMPGSEGVIRRDMRTKRADCGMTVGIDELGNAYVNDSSAGFGGTSSLVRGRNNNDDADLGGRDGRLRIGSD